MSVNDEQPENAYWLMVSTPIPIFTETIFEQFWKAYAPKLVTELGITMFSNDEQPENAELPIPVTASPSVAVVIAVQP